MSNDYGYAYDTQYDARRFTNTKRTVKGITIHHWGSLGSAYSGIIGWFCNPNTTAQTSAHYVAQGADANGTINRRVACIVSPNVIAWHAGNWQANVDTIGIECRPEARDVDYDVVAELVARLWVTYGVVPLYPHKHWVTTACPGRYDIARIKREATVKYNVLKGGKELPPTTPPKPPVTPPKPNTPPNTGGITVATEADAKVLWNADIIASPDGNKSNPNWLPASYLRETFLLIRATRDAQNERLDAQDKKLDAILDRLGTS